MKDIFSLSVAKPCSEKWEHFTSTSQGGFCHSCQKNVIDFTKMSNEEILDFFKSKPAHTCGRFRPDQLKVYSTKKHSAINSRRNLVQAGALTFLALFAGKDGYSKNVVEKTITPFIQLQNSTKAYPLDKPGHTIKGTVKDETQQPLPGVNVYLKGSSLSTITDANGKFEFPQEVKEGDVLVFSYIGFETKDYVIARNAPASIDIPLTILYVDIMGEIAVDSLYTTKPTGMSNWWQKIKSIF